MNGLLSIGQKILNVRDGVVGFFAAFSVLTAVEIILFFLMIYFVSKVLYDNEATKLMVLYWVMIVVGSVLHLFDSDLMDKQLLLVYVILLSAVMLTIFSVEVKKYFWDTQTSKEKPAEKIARGSETSSPADTERCINNIVKAVQNMSKNNVGALIVLSKGNVPRQVLHSGIELNAAISTQLIEGIFFPKAPLHDGAMVIQGHNIQAAGCFLPLTQKTSYPKEYGTRHRAAIGITEVANVVSIVVSEETGIISIVKQGNVVRYADTDMLTDALKDFYWHEMPLTEKKRR